ncbi:MAG: hypothetical protein QF632_05685 [Candidatus Woesearchaeota archaeon]|nr:hypothetical protein [Candidatus Woesearchaeota archaeon]MDP7324223.1 hypothetical protein [Candidatus Woesearchaeota archaeon]MDP7457991.1 hypothetical protein [Candidatus Woesearchaeota archaeon]
MAIRTSICDELLFLLHGYNFDDRVRFAADNWVDIEQATFVEGMPVTQIPYEEVTRRAEHMRNSNVLLTAVHWLLAGGDGVFGEDGFYIDQGPHLTMGSAERRNRTAAYVELLCQYATLLRGGEVDSENPLYAVWGSPDQRNIDESIGMEQAYRNASEVLASCITDKHPVIVAFERLVSKDRDGETNFGTTLYDVAQIVVGAREILVPERAERVYGFMDAKAAVGMGEDPAEVMRNPLMPGHVHVQDPFSLGPPGWNKAGVFNGEGAYDFRPLVERLVEINQSGRPITVSMEPFKPFFDATNLTPKETFPKSIGLVRDLIRDAGGSYLP